MKIENNGSQQISQPRLNGAGAADGARPARPARTGESAGGRDELTLSDRARLLNSARAELASQPEVRADKVEPLKHAVESGAYQVPVHQLVRRLLAHL